MHRLLHALALATGILYLLQAASAYAADAPGWQPSLLLFLGFGMFILWNFARTGNMQGAGEVRDYLLGGLGLFAPYVVNKFSSVFAPK